MSRIPILMCLLLSLYGGTETKQKPSDYPASVEVKPGFWIGADFGGHTFYAAGTSILAEDYLCIEVALFPPAGDKDFRISTQEFSLRLNKKKTLMPQTPGFVAASLKYSDYDFRPGLEAQAGPVIIGPRPQERFPGDPTTDRRNRYPAPASTDPTASAGADKEQRKPASQLVVDVAIEEGPAHAAKSGFLYFPYKGKLGKLNSIELLYRDAVVKLR